MMVNRAFGLLACACAVQGLLLLPQQRATAPLQQQRRTLSSSLMERAVLLRAGASATPHAEEAKKKKKLPSWKEMKGAVAQLVTLYGPIAIAVDFVTLMVVGWTLFACLQLGVLSPPQFVYEKVVGSGGAMGKGALNFAITVAICESVLVPFRAGWALFWTPRIAKLLPDSWKPTPATA